jgi:hypothetical protein
VLKKTAGGDLGKHTQEGKNQNSDRAAEHEKFKMELGEDMRTIGQSNEQQRNWNENSSMSEERSGEENEISSNRRNEQDRAKMIEQKYQTLDQTKETEMSR